jgi:hypothetical protein
MEVPIGKMFGRATPALFAAPRVWLRVSMPRDIPPLRTSIAGAALHSVTASNVECLNQTITFAQHGTSIPVVREAGGAGQHLVAPLSVVGEQGAAYVPDIQPSPDRRLGRFAIRNGRVELRPALWPDGRSEAYANVRLWITAGAAGNDVAPGRVTGFVRPGAMPRLGVTNATAAAGGTDVEAFGSARLRFADALLSRDRIVTRDDLRHAVRAFDARIHEADLTTGAIRTPQGLQRAEHVSVRIDDDDFVDPAAELPMLQHDLQRHLTGRFPAGTVVTVDIARS